MKKRHVTRQSRARQVRHKPVSGASFLEQEGDLHVDPPLGDLAVLHHALDVLDPGAFDVVQRGVGAANAGLDRVLDALGRSGGEFDDLGDGVAHGGLLCFACG